MAWNLNDVAAQDGRIAIVTGANSGLGFDTALALAQKGCLVIVACRNVGKANAARRNILGRHPDAKVECRQLDLSSLKSVRSFAEQFISKHTTLDLLINNAGIMVPPFSLSEDGFESQLAANYMGHFALTGLLLPLLLKTPNSRVVSLSSLAHRWVSGIRFDDMQFKNGYNKYMAYSQSKLACLMFSYELDRRLRKAGQKTLSVAAHPGISATNLAQHLPKFLDFFFPFIGQPAADGALPSLYAALGGDIVSGDYCGPQLLCQARGAPIKVGSNLVSKNESAANRLWAVSEELTGVRYLS